MNALRSSKNWLESKTKGSSAQAKKETNKAIAKDPNVRTSTRLRAAKDMVKNTADEHSHKREADVHKHAAKHNY